MQENANASLGFGGLDDGDKRLASIALAAKAQT